MSEASDDGEKPADDAKPQKPTKAPTYPDDMIQFWDAYPSIGRERSSRSKVLVVWKQQRPDPDTLSAILHGVDAWRHKPEWCERYAPAADRWLRERKWEELPKVPAVGAPSTNGVGNHTLNGKEIGYSNEELDYYIAHGHFPGNPNQSDIFETKGVTR